MVNYNFAITVLLAGASWGTVDGFSSSSLSSFPPSTFTVGMGGKTSASFVGGGSVVGVRKGSGGNNSGGVLLSMLIEPCGKDALVAIGGGGGGEDNGGGGGSGGGRLHALVSKTPPVVRKALSTASIPLGAVAGFCLTPSRRLLANAVGGGIMGVLGGVGKSRLDALAAEAALPAVARAVLDSGFPDDANVDPDALYAELVRTAADYNLTDGDDLREVLSSLYAAYLLAMCKSPCAKTSELTELARLRSSLRLPNLDVGEAHHRAAAEFYRTTCLFTPEEELGDADHPDRRRLDKLLWLSERAFRDVESSDEAVVFELARVSKALKVDDASNGSDTARERILSVAEPFYRRALSSTRAKLETDQVSIAMLQRARGSLGIDDFVKRDLHLQCYTEELRSLLVGNDNMDTEADADQPIANDSSFAEGALQRLEKLQGLLEIPDGDAQYELAHEVTPLFQHTTSDVFDRAIMASADDDDTGGASSSSQQLWEEIATRQKDLCLGDDAMAPLLDSAVVQKLGTPLEAALNFSRVGNEKGVYEALQEALKIQEALFGVLSSSGTVTREDLLAKFFSPTSPTSACGFLSGEERSTLYSFFVRQELQRSESGDDAARVAGLLALSDADVRNAARVTSGPRLERELRAAALEVTGDDYTAALADNLRTRLDALVDRLRLPPGLLREYGTATYRDSLRVVALKCPNGIPTAEVREQLASLRTLLSLDLEDVRALHTSTFGATYKKSVAESMGATGVIAPEFREPLQRLVRRLDLDDDDARTLYLEAVAGRLTPMVRLLANELERSMLTQQQLAQKTGKDQGQDVFKEGAGPKGSLGIGSDSNIMNNIMNLVDFYQENDIAQKGDDDDTVVVYPVTALGTSAIDQEMANALYRQFVVGGFTAQDATQQARYEAVTLTFGGILGLTTARMEEVGGDIGGMVYENYIKNALQTKSSLDQQDMMFLANMQTKLKLSSEQGTEMMLTAQKKVMFDLANGVLENPTARSMKTLREKCNSMGLDMFEDVGLPQSRLENMFALEVMEGIDAGEITAGNAGDLLTEVQESLGLSSDVCERVLGSIVEKKTSASIYNIEKELLRGRDENCVPEIQNMLKFAAFVGGDLEGLEVSEETANKIVNIFESLDFSDEDSELVAMSKDLLRTAVGLSD